MTYTRTLEGIPQIARRRCYSGPVQAPAPAPARGGGAAAVAAAAAVVAAAAAVCCDGPEVAVALAPAPHCRMELLGLHAPEVKTLVRPHPLLDQFGNARSRSVLFGVLAQHSLSLEVVGCPQVPQSPNSARS
eukprot:COSAG02_NODE_7970_length_2766_cov_1.593551_6_plen_132_part_00